MDIRGLGYVTVRSSDLAQWRHYASQVLGMMVVEDERGERLFLKMDERPYRIPCSTAPRMVSAPVAGK